MFSFTVNAPAPAGHPRGAALVASGFARVLGWFESAHLLRSHPLDEPNRTGDAARVRRFAQQVMADDPRFAADLFAAADRYELD